MTTTKISKATTLWLSAMFVFVSCAVPPTPPSLIIVTSSSSPTFTPTPTPTPTATPCPTGLVTTYTFNKPLSKFILVLAQGSPSYRKYVGEAFDLLPKILSKVMFPDDRLIVWWMEFDTTSTSILLDEKVKEVNAPIPKLVEPPERDLLQPPTQVPPPQAISQRYPTQTAHALTSTAVAVENQRREDKHRCDVEAFNTQSGDVGRQWQGQKGTAVQDFVTATTKKLHPNNFPNILDNKIQTYEALRYSSDVFKDDSIKGKFAKYYLIILSELPEFRRQSPYPPPQTDFTGIDILLPMMQCKYSTNCESIQSRWIPELKDSLKANVSSLILRDSIESELSTRLLPPTSTPTPTPTRPTLTPTPTRR